jgi:phosphatidylethanolamine/phosphatidyl-N-methylethanolamine N-methyltransferase
MAKEYRDSAEIQGQYYRNSYNLIHYSGFMGYFTRSYHKRLEKPFRKSTFKKILEIGADQGQHLPFVRAAFSEYWMIDKSYDQEMNHKIESLNGNEGVPSTARRSRQNAENLEFEDNTFDRVIATCVLHHIKDSAAALKEMRRVVKDGGVVSIYLPCDPGIVYRMIRHFTSHLKQLKTEQVSMDFIKFRWSLEHPNHFPGLKTQIESIFKNDSKKLSKFPIRFAGWNFNLYIVFQIQVSKEGPL